MYSNGNFYVGLLIGTAAGLTTGWLLATNSEKNKWHPLTEQPDLDSNKKQKIKSQDKPASHKKASRAAHTSIGNVEEPTGRNVSNIDDLPDRG
jgi:hypothetical protein